MPVSTDPTESDQSGSAVQPLPQSEACMVTPIVREELVSENKASEPTPLDRPVAKLNVAVIGDVMTDWAFISRERARPRFPVFKPWTRDPSTHLFAFPAGAWLSGHMIQGALSDPVFDRSHRVTIRKKSGAPATHVVLRGGLPAIRHADPQDGALIVSFEDHASDPFDIIINDEIVIDSLSVKTITATLAKGSRSPNVDFEIGLTQAFIDVESEYANQAGFFNVDQVGRCYECENVNLPGDNSGDNCLICTYLTITHATLTLDIIQTNTIPSAAREKMTAASLRIVPKNLRRGSIDNKERFKLNVSRPDGIRLKKATIEVTFGKLRDITIIKDYGKFNPPMAARSMPDDGVTTGQHLQISLVGTLPRPTVGLWIYAGPGDAISMQHPGHIVHALSQLSHFKRYLEQRNPRKVYRRLESHGIDGPQHGYPTILDEYNARDTYTLLRDSQQAIPRPTAADWKATNRRVVCIDDEGLGFGRRCDAWAPFLWPADLFSAEQAPKTYSEFLDSVKESDRALRVAEHIRETWFVIKLSHWIDSSRFDLMKFLTEFGAMNRTIVIVSGESLRRGLADSAEKPGIKLAKTVSWERTIEDFDRARQLKKLGALADCKHLIVRLGLEGGLHLHNSGVTEPTTRLWFDPELIEGEYSDTIDLGQLPGLTTTVAAVIIRELSTYLAGTDKIDEMSVHEVIDRAIPMGLTAARRYFDLGYGPTPETVRKIARLQLPISQVFSRGRIVGMRYEGRHRFVDCTVPKPLDESSWSILKLYIQGKPDPSDAFTKATSCLNDPDHVRALERAINAVSLARNIVLHGAKSAFEGLPQSFPFTRIGQLVAVDRREIQGLRSIRSLLAEYVRHDERKVPLSVAVFGPPGSGKSFGVMQIARGVTQGRAREFVFNLAQFSSFSEITRLLLQVRESALDNEIPLVFFDEFDCSYGDRPLGWLNFFLSPMQDGRFQHESSMLSIGKAIFVFAGGIASKHAEFSDPAFWKKRIGGNARDDVFVASKGPDFHSRLRGYFDVLGPNPSLLRLSPKSDASVERKFDRFSADDFTFVVRRAILLRQNIERLHSKSLPLLDSEESTEIDRDLLDALLLTDGYKHGVRSMQALFEMSSFQGEQALSKTAVPSKNQYFMHVDSSFFNILIRDYAELKSGILKGLFEYSAATPDFGDRYRDE